MITELLADESTQVLVLVCVPLISLLVLLIILLRHYNRRSVSFPNFSITISTVGPRVAYLVYRGDQNVLEFTSEFRKGKKFFKPGIVVMVPVEMPNEDLRVIVSNIEQGLAKLHYDYLIFRKTGLQPIPGETCEAAVAELRRMGIDFKISIDGQVSRSVIRQINNSWDGQASATISKVQALMRQAASPGNNIEVLACSDCTLRLADH